MIVRELLTLLAYKEDTASKKKAEGGFQDLKRSALAVSAAVAAIGAVAGSVFVRMAREVAEAGDEIAKTSKQIGVNAQRLQELRLSANLAGASNSELTTALRLLSKNADDAAKGTGEFAEDFERLGVKVTDASGNLKAADELLLDVADGMGRLATDSERTALAQSIFGRSGAKLIPLLNQGSEAIRAQAARANELGEVYDAELLGQSEAFVDAQRELSGAISGVRIAIARELIPIGIDLMNWLTDVAIMLRGPVSSGFRAFLTAMGAIGRALVLIVSLAEDLAEDITGITDALKIYAAVAVAAWIAATSPMLVTLALLGLIATALFAVIEDLEALGEGEGFFATLLTGFQQLTEEVGLLNAALEVLKTTIEFFAGEGAFKSLVEAFGGSLATERNLQVARELEAAAAASAAEAPPAFAFQAPGAGAGPVTITNNLETTVNAAPGMSGEEIARDASGRTVSGLDRVWREAKSQLGIGG